MYSPDDLFEFNLIYCDNIVERVVEEIRRWERFFRTVSENQSEDKIIKSIVFSKFYQNLQ